MATGIAFRHRPTVPRPGLSTPSGALGRVGRRYFGAQTLQAEMLLLRVRVPTSCDTSVRP